jgi:hypothetical protein
MEVLDFERHALMLANLLTTHNRQACGSQCQLPWDRRQLTKVTATPRRPQR